MGQLESLFDRQSQAREDKARATAARAAGESLIRFDAQGGTFAVPITFVREVIDGFTITPYPEPVARHVGIVSLRGRVLPVIAPDFGDVAAAATPERLLVLEFTEGEPFCVGADRVQKVLVEGPLEPASDAVVNVQGKPVRLVRDADVFFASR